MPVRSVLSDIFEPYPSLELTQGDLGAYRHFRAREPQLVSCWDQGEEKPDKEILVLREAGAPAGTVSFMAKENPCRECCSNYYARIDLVIVDNEHRNLGIGRLLIHCVITHLLRIHGDHLYSISCLAAHPAVEKVLKNLSFEGHREKMKTFWQGELKINKNDVADLTRKFTGETSHLLKIVNFHSRQKQS